AQKFDIATGGTSDPRADAYLASAQSGAGGTKLGIAGSLALNLIDTESSASIAGGATVTVKGISGSAGDVTLVADNRTGTAAKALPEEPASGGKLGIGASVALNIV